MRGFRVYAKLLLVTPLLASLCGCAEKEDGAPPEGQRHSASAEEVPAESSRGTESRGSAPEAHTEGIALGDVLALWESGKKDDAVEQLLSIAWDEPGVFGNMPVMSLSEKRFASLPDEERKRVQEEAMEVLGALRSLARHAVAAGDSAHASGDKQTAKAHYEAVLRLGQALSSSERLAIIELTGKAMVSLAQDKLSAAR